jgi:hypothetical protein
MVTGTVPSSSTEHSPARPHCTQPDTNKSVAIFAGEAYNVETGVTNELFPAERALPAASSLYNAKPEDTTNFPASGARS